MPVTDLDLITNAARKAGAIATRFFNSDPKVWEKPGQGPVTEADLAVDKMLNDMLLSARPDYGWLSEETADTDARLNTTHQFVVDPIDGTRAFIEGSKDWAISIAVVSNGIPSAAAIYLPMRDSLYAASHKTTAVLNGRDITISPTSKTVLATRPTMDGHHWKNETPPNLKRHFRSSLAYRMCLVAEGRYDAMVTLRPSWEWDIAAGSLIIERAGGIVSDRTGASLAFNSAMPQLNGVIGATPMAHADIMERLV